MHAAAEYYPEIDLVNLKLRKLNKLIEKDVERIIFKTLAKVNHLKSWYTQRMSWLDAAYKDM